MVHALPQKANVTPHCVPCGQLCSHRNCIPHAVYQLKWPAAHNTLAGQANNKGRGLENVGPEDVKNLPVPAKQELVGILNASEHFAAWPAQWLQQAICLVKKPQGGDRAIGLICWLIRL